MYAEELHARACMIDDSMEFVRPCKSNYVAIACVEAVDGNVSCMVTPNCFRTHQHFLIACLFIQNDPFSRKYTNLDGSLSFPVSLELERCDNDE